MDMKKGRIENKKSQVSIFIIISLIILVILILLFINRKQFDTIFDSSPGIEQFKDCVETSLSEGVMIIETQGGSINPENYYLYNGTKVEYLCYTEENYAGCVMQKPLLKQDIESELREFNFKKDFEFHPHITLVRVKFVKDKKSLIKSLNSIKIEEKSMDISIIFN